MTSQVVEDKHLITKKKSLLHNVQNNNLLIRLVIICFLVNCDLKTLAIESS